MIEQLLKRKIMLEENTGKAFDLLSEIENRLLTATDPLEVARLKDDEQRVEKHVKKLIEKWQQLIELIKQVREEN
jgi:hypothetical protein